MSNPLAGQVLEATLGIGASLQPSVRPLADQIGSDLRPWPTVSVVAAESPTLRGHAVMPEHWIRVQPEITDDGSLLVATRPEQDDVVLTSNVRWLPYEGTFNASTGYWNPWVSDRPGYRWASATLTRPTLETLSYRVGREILRVPSFRIRDGVFFTSDFNLGLDDAVAFTLSMAVWMQPAITSPYALLDSVSAVPGRIRLKVSELVEYGWSDAKGVVDPVVPISACQPGFVTIVVNPPSVSVTLSLGPGFSFRTVANSALPPVNTPFAFDLGRSFEAGVGRGEFNLLEINAWDHPLTDDEVASLNGAYASIYGAAHDR